MMRLALAGCLTAMLALPALAEEPAPSPEAPVSPACALLTPEVAAAWKQETHTQRDGGAPQYGMSNCSWYGADNTMIVATLMEGEVITGMGGPEKTFDMYLRSFRAASEGEPETLEGIGDKAVLLLDGEPGRQSAVLMILKGERVVSISLQTTDHDIAVAIAGAVAENF